MPKILHISFISTHQPLIFLFFCVQASGRRVGVSYRGSCPERHRGHHTRRAYVSASPSWGAAPFVSLCQGILQKVLEFQQCIQRCYIFWFFVIIIALISFVSNFHCTVLYLLHCTYFRYLLLNTAISSTWGFPSPCPADQVRSTAQWHVFCCAVFLFEW